MIRDHSGRTVSKSVKIGSVLFFNESMTSKSAFRAAAKRFSHSDKFDPTAIYYDGVLINNRWQFKPYEPVVEAEKESAS